MLVIDTFQLKQKIITKNILRISRAQNSTQKVGSLTHQI